MKKLLILLFSLLILPISINASDVYYCSEDSQIGFDVSDNYKKVDWNPKIFKILIDFENKNIISNDVGFRESTNKKCLSYRNETLYCLTNSGQVFSFNHKKLRFFRSTINLLDDFDDDPILAHGTCEKF